MTRSTLSSAPTACDSLAKDDSGVAGTSPIRIGTAHFHMSISPFCSRSVFERCHRCEPNIKQSAKFAYGGGRTACLFFEIFQHLIAFPLDKIQLLEDILNSTDLLRNTHIPIVEVGIQ